MSLFIVCRFCKRCFYRKTESIKVTDLDFLVFFTERARLESECPLNQKSSTKKHTGRIEFVGKKLPE
jgi:hypothetical protein